MIKKILIIISIALFLNISFGLKEVNVNPDLENEKRESLEKIKIIENSIDDIFKNNEPFYTKLTSRDDGILDYNELREINLKIFFNNLNKDYKYIVNTDFLKDEKLLFYGSPTMFISELVEKVYLQENNKNEETLHAVILNTV